MNKGTLMQRIINGLNPFRGIKDRHMAALILIAYFTTLTYPTQSNVIRFMNEGKPFFSSFLALWCVVGFWYLVSKEVGAMGIWVSLIPQFTYFGFSSIYWAINYPSTSIIGVMTHGLVVIQALYLINKRLEVEHNGLTSAD